MSFPRAVIYLPKEEVGASVTITKDGKFDYHLEGDLNKLSSGTTVDSDVNFALGFKFRLDSN
jgi:hypothetical protein